MKLSNFEGKTIKKIKQERNQVIISFVEDKTKLVIESEVDIDSLNVFSESNRTRSFIE